MIILTKQKTGCLLCGKPLVYSPEVDECTCAICGNIFDSNAVCENGHFVCDKCHASSQEDFLSILRHTDEQSPVKLFNRIAALDGVHMHGPEHHIIIPGIMLTAYRNNGGELNLNAALDAAAKRGGQVPGGVCGFWGACGGAIGAGIYASVVTGSNPLVTDKWGAAQGLTSSCLARNAEIGGPRCCKRAVWIAIEESVRFTRERLDVSIPLEHITCGFHGQNKECLYERCPFYG